MPDVQQGLSNAVDDGSDPNTEAGFEAALARAVGREAPEPTEAAEAGLPAGIAAGLETAEESTDQPRGDDGRFLPRESAAEVSESEEEQGAAPEASEQESGTTEEQVSDPELESLLAQHNGDVNAALVALVEERRNAQSVIGRQGNELGELRTRLERIEARQDQPVQQLQQPQAPAPSRAELADAIAEYGFQTVMNDIIDRFPDQIETVIDAGYDVEDPEARRFERAYLRNLATAPKPPDPEVETLRVERQLAQTVTSELGEYDARLHKSIREKVPEVMSNIGPLLQKGLVSSDAQERAEAVRFILRDAASRVSDTAAATATVAGTERAKATAEAKRKTAVATGSLRPVGEGQAGSRGELTSEERQRIFKEQLLSTETTSVQEGLTYGK